MLPKDAPQPREAGIKSIEVGCRLLEALACSKCSLTLNEAAQAAAMSTSKAHRYMVSFKRAGLVQQDEQTRRYFLGPLAARLGIALGGQVDMRERLRKMQRSLRDHTGHTVLLSTWTPSGPVVIATEDGSAAVIATMKVGSALPLTSSAAGRVFAAFMAWPIVRPLVTAELRRRLGTSEIGPLSLAEAEIQTALSQVRLRGIETSRGSMLRHINAIAAPFITQRSELIGVLSVIGDADTLDLDLRSPVSIALRQSALEFQITPG